MESLELGKMKKVFFLSEENWRVSLVENSKVSRNGSRALEIKPRGLASAQVGWGGREGGGRGSFRHRPNWPGIFSVAFLRVDSLLLSPGAFHVAFPFRIVNFYTNPVPPNSGFRK